MARTVADRIAAAQDAFEAGFLSMAAKKRAQDELSRAFDDIRSETTTAILAARTEANDAENSADYWGLCFDLHQVRDKHIDIVAKYGCDAQSVRDLVALRAAIKDAEIAPAREDKAGKTRIETIRRSIVEEMERRQAAFIEGLDLTRLWNEMFPRKDGGINLPVSVNAHWVHGHKGAVFLRHFFYLRGKLTPLNTIIAIAETLEREAR